MAQKIHVELHKVFESLMDQCLFHNPRFNRMKKWNDLFINAEHPSTIFIWDTRLFCMIENVYQKIGFPVDGWIYLVQVFCCAKVMAILNGSDGER